MGIWNRLYDGFDLWVDGKIISIFIGITGLVCFSLFLFFWFIVYLVYIPLNWLWVHRLRNGITEILKHDRLKEAN